MNEPYQTIAPSTNSTTDAKPTVHASPAVDTNPLVNVTLEINGQPILDAKPVEESGQAGDSTAVAGNHRSFVDSSAAIGLQPTAGEGSQTYTAEDGITNKVTETRAESKVH